MAMPNFFVIGAQKCGTDALYLALRQHPDIFMSPEKEPSYFITEGRPPDFRIPNPGYAQRVIHDRDRYLALFAGAGGRRAVGEASAVYLSSYEPERTAERIWREVPDARLIALVRQPADRAYSAFQFYRARELEPLADFEAALADEPARVERRECPDLRHRMNGCYARNLRPFYDRFPHDQIRVYLQEDWSGRPNQVLRDIFGFLGVDQEFQPVIERANVTTRYRSRYLRKFFINPNRSQRVIQRLLPTAAKASLRRWNETSLPPFPHELRARLTLEYRDDILALQDLIGRDLSHWLEDLSTVSNQRGLNR